MKKDFYTINSTIQDYLSNLKIDESFTKTYWKLSTNDAIFCAEDTIRNKAFFKAIKKAISDTDKKEIVVVDAWSWTWILWFFSIFLWASKCIFIEQNEISLEISKKLAKHLWIFEKCFFIKWDACKVNIEENYDLIISETITTWFEKEDFPLIVENLKKENVKIIPEKFVFSINWFDKYWVKLEEKEVNVSSYNLFKNRKIRVKRKASYLEIITKTVLYNDVLIKTWDSFSFINKRVHDLKYKHNFLQIIKNYFF